MSTHLDNFRIAYTLNWQSEKDASGRPLGKLAKGWNAVKVLTWFPIIGQITAGITLVNQCKSFKDNPNTTKQAKIALISRHVIGLTGVLNPGLFFVDIAGTAVKCIIDARAKK